LPLAVPEGDLTSDNFSSLDPPWIAPASFVFPGGIHCGFSETIPRESTAPMTPDAGNEGPRAKTLMLGAFAIVYVVWGSTYLAIRVAVETMPPFLMAGTRFLVAGGVLFAWLRLRGAPMPSRLHWRNSAIVGVLLLLGGNGLVVWAEQSVPSGLAALLICLSPVWFALFDWARPGGTRPSATTWLGIAVGFSGVVLLVTGRDGGLASAGVGIGGFAALMVACASWAAGSVFNRYNAKPDSHLLGAAMQMLCKRHV